MKTTATIDPVCGMEVNEASARHADHDGVTYHFCSAGCREKFLADPGEFTDAGANQKKSSEVHQRQQGRGKSWRDYIPLLVIVALTLLAASAKQAAYAGPWDGASWMHDFMGFFLVVFSMFKFFDMEGFADGFHMYDLLARAFRPYGYVYPFIELGLGLGYLAHWQPALIYWATIVVMLFGSLGVFRALLKGLDIECACLGTTLKVPLSTVAVIEDIGMAVMAAAMLWMTR